MVKHFEHIYLQGMQQKQRAGKDVILQQNWKKTNMSMESLVRLCSVFLQLTEKWRQMSRKTIAAVSGRWISQHLLKETAHDGTTTTDRNTESQHKDLWRSLAATPTR